MNKLHNTLFQIDFNNTISMRDLVKYDKWQLRELIM